MRLTFVITNAPPLVGGLEKVCLRLAQQLKKEGHTVRILGRFTEERHKLAGYFRDTQKPGVIDCEGIKVEVLTLDARAKLLLSPVFKLVWRKSAFPLARRLYVAALGPQLRKACAGSDVVHYFGVGREMLGFAAADAARATGAAFCVDPAVHPGQWGSFWIDEKLFRSADRMFCYSEEEKNALRDMGVEASAIRKVPCGFDYNDSGNGDRFRGLHRITGPMVLFLGRKTLEKGVGRLLEAWPEVAARFPEATLVFAGPRKGKEEALKKLKGGKAEPEPKAETGLSKTLKPDKKEDRGSELGDGGEEKLKSGELKPENGEDCRASILDLDDLTEGEKQDALAACDVLCVPSEGESFGMVYFEAWAYSKPVVALDLPVLRETVGAADAGSLVAKDPRAIAESIVTLLEDPDARRRMGENGRKLALGHTWAEAARHYVQGYKDAMKKQIL